MNSKKFKIKIAIIGYGSIGQKHFKVLSKIVGKSNLFVISKHLNKDRISILDQLRIINPDYIVISNQTSDHYYVLKLVLKNFDKKKILVEKPLFNHSKLKLNTKKNKIYIGYNLRFSPVIKFLKNFLKSRKVFFAKITCESYLPNWRKQAYFKSSSSKTKFGGGVVNDLSHEIDYCNLILGNFKDLFFINKKISNLKIDTKDFFGLYATSDKAKLINLNLSYFSKNLQRKIFIDYHDGSLEADLLKNKICFFEKKKRVINFLQKPLQTYRDQHISILNGDEKYLINYRQALFLQKRLDKYND